MKRKIWVLFLIAMLFVNCVCAENALLITNEQAEELKNLGIMVGDLDGNMRFGDTITRSEAAKMLCVVAKLDTENFD